MPPLIRGIEEPAAVEGTDVLLPQQFPIHVVTDHQPNCAEDGDDVAAVGDRGGVGLARLRVPLRSRSAAEHLARPDLLAGVQIQRVHAPAVMRQVLHGRDIAVQAGAERRVLGTGRGDGNHSIAPDDGAGGGQPRNGQLPADVAPGRNVPVAHRALSIGGAVRIGAAERRPRTGRGAGRGRWGGGGRRACDGRRGRCLRGNGRGRGRVGKPLTLVAEQRRSRARSSIARQCRRGPRR